MRLEFQAIGTAWTVDAEGVGDAASLEAAIAARIEAFDRAYSRFRQDSLVSDMAARAGTYRLPEDARPMLDLYRQAYDLTGGQVTPLIGQVLVEAGYDADYSLTPRQPTTPPAWDEVLDYRYPELILRKPALLDFGAAGKGYLVDLVGEIIGRSGATSYAVNAGGDILCENRGLVVGLEHPEQAGQVIGTVTITGGSVCGSAGNRRRWAGYHHIIDPFSLESPRRVLAVWAMAGNALLADMLTTCLYFGKGRELAREREAEFVIVYEDYSVETSPGFPGHLFT